MSGVKYLIAACMLSAAPGALLALQDTCAALPWEAVLEDWATGTQGVSSRQGRVMSLGPTKGYYVSDRIDLVPPPPPRPRPSPPMSHRGPMPLRPQPGAPNKHPPLAPSPLDSYQPQQNGPTHSTAGSNYNTMLTNEVSAGSAQYEWPGTPPPPPDAGKILNRPPNPYKDQFKPSYPPPSPIPFSEDRVDTPAPTPAAPAPQKAVSETDLYLLRAIEKLVYRVDLMEKRMRKMEDSMHLIVVGAEPKPDPCESNFTRVGKQCYFISSDAVNWKSASYACRKLKANLLELVGEERGDFIAGIKANKKYNGMDFWTGGLNPGLLWIWSHSATAVLANSTESSTAVPGDGRCLALVARAPAPPAAASANTQEDYVYMGQDCSIRHRYVCEQEEDRSKVTNEIARAARALRDKMDGGTQSQYILN